MRSRTSSVRGSLAAALAAGFLALGSAGWAAAQEARPDNAARGEAATAVNVNTATQSELETVRGIGPALAKRIVEFRDEHGPFRRLEDLMKVPGIGEKSLEKLRPYLTIGKER